MDRTCTIKLSTASSSMMFKIHFFHSRVLVLLFKLHFRACTQYFKLGQFETVHLFGARYIFWQVLALCVLATPLVVIRLHRDRLIPAEVIGFRPKLNKACKVCLEI